MPEPLKRQLAADPFMKACARRLLGHECDCRGRITWEHSLKYKGQQVQEWWAIVPLCEYHHLHGGLIKDFGVWVALNRAPAGAFEKYPRSGWEQQRIWLESRYGDKSP